MRANPAHQIHSIASHTFPLAAPQGEERAATSKTRRRRSDSLGTRSMEIAYCAFTAASSAQTVASPPTRRTLVAAHSSRAAHPGAFGPSSWLSRRSQSRAKLSRGERRASQQHGPRRAPPAPSLLTPVRSHVQSFKLVTPPREILPRSPTIFFTVRANDHGRYGTRNICCGFGSTTSAVRLHSRTAQPRIQP